LLVIIIFLMLTTTYSKFSGLEINLPTADASKQAEQPNEIDVAVTASGQILVNKSPLAATDVKAIAEALRRAAGSARIRSSSSMPMPRRRTRVLSMSCRRRRRPAIRTFPSPRRTPR
jgi:biopolymer transport protein ExbD